MKKLYTLLVCSALVGVFILAAPEQARTSANQPVASKTGAPGETTCASCHTNSGGGTGKIEMTFSGGNTYVPGNTYTITVTVTDVAVKYGFELTALDASNAKAGTLIVTNITNTVKPTSGAIVGREYISHKAASSNSTWSFDWTAPATNIGDVTFYYSGNAANGNNGTAGDRVYAESTTISTNTAVAMTGDSQAMFYVQSPVSDILKVSYTLESASNMAAELYDVTGKKIMDIEQTQAGAGNHSISKPLIADVTPGLYFVRFYANNTVQTSKVIVL